MHLVDVPRRQRGVILRGGGRSRGRGRGRNYERTFMDDSSDEDQRFLTKQIDGWCICPNFCRDDFAVFAGQSQSVPETVGAGPSQPVQDAVGAGLSRPVQDAVGAGPSRPVQDAVGAGPSQPVQEASVVAGHSRAVQAVAVVSGPSQVRIQPYFKSYTLIPGTQKTHDTAILEAILEYMTVNQVLNTNVQSL